MNVLNLIPSLAGILFYVVLLAFTIHAMILGYHWFTYGVDRKRSLSALGFYLIGVAVFCISLSVLLTQL